MSFITVLLNVSVYMIILLINIKLPSYLTSSIFYVQVSSYTR